MPGLSLTLHQSTLATRTWALVPGIREAIVVALVVVALYGRSMRVGNRWPFAVGSPAGSRPDLFLWLLDRRWLVLAFLVGASLAAWVATSLQVIQTWAAR